jgi:hypothetical protein
MLFNGSYRRVFHLFLLPVVFSTLSACGEDGAKTNVRPAFGIEASYDGEYVERRAGNVAVSVPEVFELANIAFAITDYGIENPYRVFKDSDYYTEVMNHFEPYADHPLIEHIEFSDARVADYFSWRTASLAYRFEGQRLADGEPYAPAADAAGWFHDQRELIEDFAAESGFREFYAEHRAFYEEQRASYRKKVPVRRMWRWLETQFPARYDGYVVVFSLLIDASHNTLRFEDSGYRECVMVVGGPDLLAGRTNDARVEEALLSRHVFTEIDHNYVNPVSNRHVESIDTALAELDAWNAQQGYGSPLMTFNEYVTWAVFMIYAAEYYDGEVFDLVRSYQIRTMEGSRGFVRFGDFVRWLEGRWADRGTEEKLVDLYPEMIDWFASK